MQRPKIPNAPNPENLTPIICKKCKCPFFISVMRVLELSALDPTNTTGQPAVVPVPTLMCVGCQLEIGQDPPTVN